MSDRRGHLVDEIYAILIERIVNGVYLPGRKLSQKELAEELDVSRTPLREALNRIQQTGLVVATTNRGMEVAPVTIDEAEELYAMRLLIEPPVVGAITSDLTARELRRMTTALERMRETADHIIEFQDAHHQFHEVVLGHYPDALREVIDTIYLKVTRHQRVYFSRPRVPEEFCEIDNFLLDAFRNRDGLSAKRILQFHLIDAALGLMRDATLEFTPSALIMAARGVGIQLTFSGTGRDRWPALIKWDNGWRTTSPKMVTTNLKHEVSG